MSELVKFKRLNNFATVPTRATVGSAGWDLYSSEYVELYPGDIKAIPLGFSTALPQGFSALICPRSGMALKHGVTVLNGPGVIDDDYRGEWKVILHNAGREVFLVTKGLRIAQMVLTRVIEPLFDEVPELPVTGRSGGFGSTGK